MGKIKKIDCKRNLRRQTHHVRKWFRSGPQSKRGFGTALEANAVNDYVTYNVQAQPTICHLIILN
ncbi:hypothetical protein SAMN03159341_13810 [Paenibacillus sp. 1_12]|nr:hypothetical protein SAMN03159341_13810 [Paenibacillus sp. 1_12]